MQVIGLHGIYEVLWNVQLNKHRTDVSVLALDSRALCANGTTHVVLHSSASSNH